MKFCLKSVIACLLCLVFLASCAGETPPGTETSSSASEQNGGTSGEPSSDPSSESVTTGQSPSGEENTTDNNEANSSSEEGSTTGGEENTPLPEKLKNLAQTVISAFGSVPEPWSFLPAGMQPSAHTFSGTAPDYASATALSAIPANGIGKQMHAVYSTLNRTETALGYLNNLYAGLSTIASLYQSYINKNPEHYAAFEGSWNMFAFRITVSETEYLLLAKAGSICIELHHDIASSVTEGRIDCGEQLTVKYRVTASDVSFAVNAAELYISSLEFVRKDNTVTGYIYETVGSGSARLSSSAILTVTEDYTIAVGNKGDFAVPGQGVNVEVYNSRTGMLLGTEVYETVKLVDYDTLWFDLHQVTGINTVSAEFGTSINTAGKNPDSVYINGAKTVFAVIYNTVFGVKTSRQFDIEFKTMYFYTYNAEKKTYEETEVKVPMLFVQRNALSTYLSDIQKENQLAEQPHNLTDAKDNAVIAEAYLRYKDAYLQMKDLLTPEAIISFIGIRNEWFASVTSSETA